MWCELGVLFLVLCALAYAIYERFKNKKPTKSQVGEDTDTEDEESVDTIDVGEKWLEDNDLEDDSYGSILNDYCLLKDTKVPVKIVNVNLNDKKISLSLSFPRTDIIKIIPVNVKTINFKIDETIPSGNVLASVTVSEDCECDVPDYDSEVETPLERVDWDQVICYLSFDLHLSQETYDKIFPSLV